VIQDHVSEHKAELNKERTPKELKKTSMYFYEICSCCKIV